jgi:hypothetical protein
MPKTIKIKNVEQIKKQIKDYFTINEDARFVRRLDVIILIKNRNPCPLGKVIVQ